MYSVVIQLKKVYLLIYLLLVSNIALSEALNNLCRNLEQKPVVTFIVPDFEASPFWVKLGALTQKASKDLSIDLRFHLIPNENRSRFNYDKKIETILLNNPETNYLVAPFLSGAEERMMALIEKRQIKFISYNSPLTNSVKQRIGLPRKEHPLWLAHVSPDDERVGYDVAQMILNSLTDQPIKMVAINGSRDSAVANMRLRGLRQAIEENNNIELLQIVDTDWSYNQSAEKTMQLLQRYKGLNAVWTASDSMAIGVIEQWQALNKRGAPPLVAGIDWTQEMIPYIQRKEVLASFGGHIFEGAWIMVLIKDHFHGLDFYNENSGVIHYPMKPLTANNIDLLANINDLNRSFDTNSKCMNKHVTRYAFDALHLISKQLPNDE